MDSPVLIGGEPKQNEQIWIPMAHRSGVWRPLTPKYHFPVCGSYDEVMNRIADRLARDNAFALHWDGWNLAGARVDRQITVRIVAP